MANEDVVMTLFYSQPSLFDDLITALEISLMKELTLDFITIHLVHEVSKKKENEPQWDDATMLSRQPRAFDNNKQRADNPVCYNCGKLGHIACNYQSKHNVNANIARSSDDFAFVVRDGVSNIPATRWIVDLGASQHMTPHNFFFNTHVPISGRKVFIGANDMIDFVCKGFILVETEL